MRVTPLPSHCRLLRDPFNSANIQDEMKKGQDAQNLGIIFTEIDTLLAQVAKI